MNEHPMQPSPEQFAGWLAEAVSRFPAGPSGEIAAHVARRAYAAGADAELEACVEWFDRRIPGYEMVADQIRAARRPKPPSLANEALRALGSPAKIGEARVIERGEHNAIRRALERLAELEAAQDSPSDHH